ncbi:MAG: GGDEF domain-containing protein [Acidimicrobiales bacterium]
MVLLPIIVIVVLGASTAAGKWTQREHAIRTRSDAVVLQSLMQARAALTDEFVPTAAIVYAGMHGINVSALDTLLGIDFATELLRARTLVDNQSIFATTPKLRAERAALSALRIRVDARSASLIDVQTVFDRIATDLDPLWTHAFSMLASTAGKSGAGSESLRQDVTALELTSSAFRAGLSQSGYTEQILTRPTPPQVVANLIGANALLNAATAGFPQALGPRARAAWESLTHNSAINRFNGAVVTAVSAGLRRSPPPYATNLAGNATVFRGEVAKVDALASLGLAASADLRTAAVASESSATNGLVEEMALLILLVGLVLAAALGLARYIDKPLVSIAQAAHAVRQGDFAVDHLPETGPRELALAALAFNDMASTLRAVETHAVALAGRDLTDPALQVPLPGRTGQALQAALDRLQTSVRDAEARRRELHRLATRDSLTGLLSRGAALDAIARDLLIASREDTVVALLFIDLDGLKAINDNFGHQAGDQALRVAAEAINASTRGRDIRARIGGDEFVVAQLNPPSQETLSATAERIRQRIAEAMPELHGRRVKLGASIGIAVSVPNADTAEDLLRRADIALYQAKEAGRDRVVWFRTPTSRSA